MSRFYPGDIIEIEVPKGLAYLQVTSLHPLYPEVIRHLDGVHKSRPTNLETLASQPGKIIGMAPVSTFINSGSIIGRKVGTTNIPEDYRTFPTFKIPICDKQGAVVYCWFWEGEGIWHDANPTIEKDNLPVREVMSASMLLDKVS